MSVWAHVNASFRLDSIGAIRDEVIINLFGKAVDSHHMYDEVEFDDDGNVKDKEKWLPIGSEGTLEMSIWHNPNKSCLASTTVNVFGDLRDYKSFDELEQWFNRVCEDREEFYIRQAVMQVEIGGSGSKIYQYKEKEYE